MRLQKKIKEIKSGPSKVKGKKIKYTYLNRNGTLHFTNRINRNITTHKLADKQHKITGTVLIRGIMRSWKK